MISLILIYLLSEQTIHLPTFGLNAACFTACYQTVTLPKYIHVIVKACATEHRPDMVEAMKYECL